MPPPLEIASMTVTSEVANDEAGSDQLVTISRWELEALRERAKGIAAGAVMEPESTPSLPKSTNREDEVRDRKAAEMERAFKAAIRDRELATALAGRPLLPGAAVQLIKLWRDDFDVIEEGGEFLVSARDGRPVAKAVGERLSEAEYAHFSPPSSRGGASAKGSGRSMSVESMPRTLGEAVLRQWREAASTKQDPASGPIGLRRR
jgi:hypothetical protein